MYNGMYMKQEKHKPLASVIVQYSSSRFFQLVLGAVTAFLRPRLLTPEQYGIWTLFELIPRYASYLHLGTRDTMRFFIPFYASRGDYDKTEMIKGSVFTSSLLINLLLSCLLIILSFNKGFTTEVRAGFFVMSLIVILLFFKEYYIALLRAYENFSLIATSTYLNTAALLVLTIPLLYFLKLYGLYITILSAYIIIVVFLRIKYNHGITYKFDFSTLKELFVKGAPIMVSDFSIQLITTSDRFVVSGLMGSTELGYYGIAILVVSFLIQIPGAAREIMEPRLMRIVENTSSEKVVNDYLLKPLINTAYLMPFIIAPVFILTPVIIPWILPRYVNGIVPAQILSIGVYFLALAYVPRAVIVANNLQLKAAAFLPFILVFNIVISVILVKRGLGLPGAAIGSSIAFVVLFLTLFLFLSKSIKDRGNDWKSHIIGMCLPFPLMFFLLWVLYSIFPVFITNRFLCAFVILSFLWIAMYFFHIWACGRYRLLKSIRIT
jgi:O-antigen/teichoic acid export membrane protein